MSPSADFILTNARVFTSDENQSVRRGSRCQGKPDRIMSGAILRSKRGAGRGRGSSMGRAKHCYRGSSIRISIFYGGVSGSETPNLQEVRTQDDLKHVLLEFAAENKTTTWVLGRGIKYGIVSTRQELDAMIADRPVYVGAYDGHTAWANTKALEMAGILHAGKEIGPNGIIVRDEAGIATGELREGDAMNAVHNLVPEPDAARKRELLKLAMKQITATGVTSVHNMNGDMEEMLTYAAVEDAGEMLLRVYVPYWVKPDATEAMLSEAAAMAKVQGEYARGGAAKFFMDGVWESYTALNIDPYADDPDATEDGIWSLERFTQMAAACDKMGLQIFVHACGDGAVRRTLDGYEAVQKMNGKRDSRHRVEHIEVIHPG
jgi:predicted amidohydrolase YtcJ